MYCLVINFINRIAPNVTNIYPTGKKHRKHTQNTLINFIATGVSDDTHKYMYFGYGFSSNKKEMLAVKIFNRFYTNVSPSNRELIFQPN